MPSRSRWIIQTVRWILGALLLVSVSVTVWLSGSSAPVNYEYVFEYEYCPDGVVSSTVSSNLCDAGAPSSVSSQVLVPAVSSSSSSMGEDGDDDDDEHPLQVLAIANSPNNIMSHHQAPPTRILLGIFSSLNGPTERHRRHLIRDTYVDFDRLHRPDQPNRVCALRDYLNFWTTNKPRDNHRQQPMQSCRLIYTFVLGPEDTTKDTTTDMDAATIFSGLERGAELSETMFEKHRHEKDVLYFNVNETDTIGKRWSWLRYASSSTIKRMMTNATKNNGDVPWLVAYTDAHVLLKPTIFGIPTLFWP